MKRLAQLAAVAVALCVAVGPALAEESRPGISVIGLGVATAKPTQAEVVTTISGSAELAADAVTKFRDQERRAQDMVKKLAMTGLTLEQEGAGFSIPQHANPMMAMNGNQAAAKETVQVSRRAWLVLKGVDAMPEEKLIEALSKIADAAKDAGLNVSGEEGISNGESPNTGATVVVFRLPPEAAKALREKATQEALSEAKQKAERIARLAGLKLGRITGVHEVPSSDSAETPSPAPTVRGDRTLSRATVEEIPLSVSLNVEFALEK